MIMAAVFGTTLGTDAWLMASVLPNLLFSSFDTTLTNVVIPILSDKSTLHEDLSVKNYINELFTLVMTLSLGLIAIIEWKIRLLLHLIAPGFHGHKFHVTMLMAQIMIPTVLFWNLTGIIKGILQSRHVFVPSSIAPLLMNIVRVLTIITLGWSLGIEGVAIGFTLSVIVQTCYLIASLRHQHVRLRWRWSFHNPFLVETFRLSVPFFYGTTVGIGWLMVDRVLASSLPTGNIAALNYSLVVAQLPVTLLLTAIITPWYTRMAQQRHGPRHSYRAFILKGFGFTTLLLIPLTLSFIVFRIPLLSLIYQHGIFHHGSTRLTAHDFLYWTIGMPATGWALYLSKVLFANRATRVVLWNTTISIGVNVLLDLLLIRPMGGAGLALGTSIAAWVRTILMIFQIRHTVFQTEK